MVNNIPLLNQILLNMQNRTKIFLILTLMFVFISCKDKDSVDIALDYASTNRTELIKALSHYEGGE